MASEHWICTGFPEVMADPKIQPVPALRAKQQWGDPDTLWALDGVIPTRRGLLGSDRTCGKNRSAGSTEWADVLVIRMHQIG